MPDRDRDWPTRCTLEGCTKAHIRPHHHHMGGGHLVTAACACAQVDEPGTRPFVDRDGRAIR